jgi:hypothetical protein
LQSTIPVNGGPACNFKVIFQESVGPNAKEPALCNKLINGEDVTSISFTAKAQVGGEAYVPADSKIYNWLASGTSIGNMGKLDFANNGTSRNVVEMNIASSAGAGCDETFYDLLDDTENHLASDNLRMQLMELQNVNLEDVFPIRGNSGYAACGNAPRFFTYQGKVYFENKPAQWPPVDEGNSYHRVARLDGGKAVDVCDFSFKTRVK